MFKYIPRELMVTTYFEFKLDYKQHMQELHFIMTNTE